MLLRALPYYFVITVFLFAQSCTKEATMKNEYPIIPKPTSLTEKPGVFTIDPSTTFILPENGDDLKSTMQVLNAKFKTAAGFELKTSKEVKSENVIVFQPTQEITNQEAYQLRIQPDQIIVAYKETAGAFYAMQTLRQLLPTDLESQKKTTNTPWSIPCGIIEDAPRYTYRGMHLDVARHFSSIEFVKSFIDLLAFHKLNYFHWHLTDDQGWRIEIKKYPKLQEIAAFRKETLIGHYNDTPQRYDGKRYGGFYTQKEIKEVIAYAQERQITIIPEIEMPGHAQAVLTAYPQFGCHDEPLEVMTKWGVSENLFCPTEETFSFLEDILVEVIELFPGEYIHVGGDECPKVQWEKSAFCQQLMKKEGLKDEMELQSYFIRRVEKMISSRGKRMIGWDEIMEGGIAPGATIMSWQGMTGGIEAAKEGHDVVMSPTSHTYFDYYQSGHPDEPTAIGGFVPLEKVYSFEPTPPELNETEAKHILGGQANIWTEYMPRPDIIEYMILPRMSALAETVWSMPENRNYEDFVNRLTTHLVRLQNAGKRVALHIYDPQSSIASGTGKGVQMKLSAGAKKVEIRYTTDGTKPNINSPKYEEPLEIKASQIVQAGAFLDKESIGRFLTKKIEWHEAAGQQIELENQPAEKYSAGGKGAVINGVKGSDDRYGDEEWLGFNAKDFKATISLNKENETQQISMRFFNGPGQWIYPPRQVNVQGSIDGVTYERIGEMKSPSGKNKVIEVMIPVKKGNYSSIKIEAQRYGIIEEGQQGAGFEAWLFVDEIMVE